MNCGQEQGTLLWQARIFGLALQEAPKLQVKCHCWCWLLSLSLKTISEGKQERCYYEGNLDFIQFIFVQFIFPKYKPRILIHKKP